MSCSKNTNCTLRLIRGWHCILSHVTWHNIDQSNHSISNWGVRLCNKYQMMKCATWVSSTHDQVAVVPSASMSQLSCSIEERLFLCQRSIPMKATCTVVVASTDWSSSNWRSKMLILPLCYNYKTKTKHKLHNCCNRWFPIIIHNRRPFNFQHIMVTFILINASHFYHPSWGMAVGQIVE